MSVVGPADECRYNIQYYSDEMREMELSWHTVLFVSSRTKKTDRK